MWSLHKFDLSVGFIEGHTCTHIYKTGSICLGFNPTSLTLGMRTLRHREFKYRVRAPQSWKWPQEKRLSDCRLYFFHYIPEESIPFLCLFISRKLPSPERELGWSSSFLLVSNGNLTSESFHSHCRPGFLEERGRPSHVRVPQWFLGSIMPCWVFPLSEPSTVTFATLTDALN